MGRAFAALRLALLCVIACASARARADFFSGSRPGPLTKAHANLDNRDHCTDCHVDGRKVGKEKCIACHQPIAERQREGKGLHATQKAQGRPCEICHTEHKGAERDLMGWGAFGTSKEKFEHNQFTQYPLEGKHANVACDKCHTQKTATGTKTYLKAPTACASCHNNPHGETRDPIRKCERCHDARSWKMLERPTFDHDKDTRYPIEKKHENVICVRCHARTSGTRPPSSKTQPSANADGLMRLTFRYSGWSFDCTPCHDNVHGQSLFGIKQCKLCHSAKVEWAKINFDHDRRTKFVLDGAHEKKATCRSCHKPEDRAAPSKACAPCHVDAHKGRFAAFKGNGSGTSADCGTCHTANVWKPENKFDHTRMTRFPLTGAHAGADCRACHRGKVPSDWEHLEQLIQKVPGQKSLFVECMGCHRHENAHQKQYTNDKCLECHKKPGVEPTEKEMNRDPVFREAHGPHGKFRLTEGHKNVDCAKCHVGRVFPGAPKQCGPKCHADQLHKGSLGDNCIQCHTGGKWEARLFDHDKHTNWPLVGNHRDVLCDSCHPRRDFAANRGKSRTCYNCHKKDDAHDGELGTHCEKCHIPDGSVKFDHNDPKLSDWPLEGRHFGVECNQCHKSIRFKPTKRECGGCHGEPDVHRGQLGTLCGRCHDAKDWRNIHTQHDVPAIRFAGAHDRITCYKCHTLGKLLEGTGPLCVTCHRNDDVHNNGLGPNCARCHTQNTWSAARFDHNTVGCNLTGVHRMVPCVRCHTGGNFAALSTACVSCHQADRIRAAANNKTAGVGHTSYTGCSHCHNVNFFRPADTLGTYGNRRESVCQ